MDMLQIYAQPAFHDEAWIIGDYNGLQKLRDAIDRALLNGMGKTDVVFVSDGEGYNAYVVEMNTGDNRWTQLEPPYTEDFARGAGGVYPGVMFRREEARKVKKVRYTIRTVVEYPANEPDMAGEVSHILDGAFGSTEIESVEIVDVEEGEIEQGSNE